MTDPQAKQDRIAADIVALATELWSSTDREAILKRDHEFAYKAGATQGAKALTEAVVAAVEIRREQLAAALNIDPTECDDPPTFEALLIEVDRMMGASEPTAQGAGAMLERLRSVAKVEVEADVGGEVTSARLLAEGLRGGMLHSMSTTGPNAIADLYERARGFGTLVTYVDDVRLEHGFADGAWRVVRARADV